MRVNDLVETSHTNSTNAGWWKDKVTGEDMRDKWYAFPVKLMLVVTELAEACEGDRQDLPDTHLPQYSMVACELADAMIRIADLAGQQKVDLEEVINAKIAYNIVRPDHKEENRAKKNGKKY